MSTEKIYKVFVSSTYEDLREERAAIQKALLQLNCFPVGMELFPAADDETWAFIQTQIDDSDYYVVVVAGRYGSLAPDGLSFTEKEYDYALSKKKPVIGFVHGDPGSIPVNKTDTSDPSKSKLAAFLEKIKQRPVRQFSNPHTLALEVTTSFVQLIKNRPAVGYIRTNEAVDYKRYAALLEEYQKEKNRADELAERLQPKLRIDFNETERGCFHETRFTNGPRLKLASIRIEAAGVRVIHDCEADLVSLRKNGGDNLLIQGLPLIIAPAERPNATRKDLKQGRPELVNVIGIVEDNSVRLWTENFSLPNYLTEGGSSPIAEPGLYRLRITVFGSETAPSSIELAFNWTGNWLTAKVSLWHAENA